MSNRTISVGTHVSLRKYADRIVDGNLHKLSPVLDDLIDTMVVNNLTHLAAPQINENFCIFVVRSDVIDDDLKNKIELIHHANSQNMYWCIINPEIRRSQTTRSCKDECISCDDKYIFIPRSVSLTMTWLSTLLDSNTMTLVGDICNIIEHNVDHLNGILYTDHANYRQRQKLISDKNKKIKIQKQQRRSEHEKSVLEKLGLRAYRVMKMKNNTNRKRK